MKGVRVFAAVGIAAGLVIAACSGGPDGAATVLDAGADARGGPRPVGSSGTDPDGEPDASSGDDDDVEHPCTGKVVINEIQIGGDDGAEFIELFNPTDCAIYLADWKLLYRSANDVAGVGQLHNFGAADSIRARTFLLLTNSKFVGTKDAELKGAMSNEGGQVGLVQPLEDGGRALVDGIGYGKGDGGATKGMYTEGSAVEAPPPGASLGRKKDGKDSDDNASDFVVFAKHTARVSNQ